MAFVFMFNLILPERGKNVYYGLRSHGGKESSLQDDAQQSVQLTCGSLRGLEAFFWLWVFSTSQTLSTPAHTPLTQTVGTPLAQQ